jgi:hypothetical protein
MRAVLETHAFLGTVITDSRRTTITAPETTTPFSITLNDVSLVGSHRTWDLPYNNVKRVRIFPAPDLTCFLEVLTNDGWTVSVARDVWDENKSIKEMSITRVKRDDMGNKVIADQYLTKEGKWKKREPKMEPLPEDALKFALW